MQILQGKARITGLEPAYDLRWPHHCRSVVHGYWLIFSCRLERPAPPHHVRIIYACFTNPSKHAPLLAFFFCNFCSVATEFLLSLLTLIFNLFTLLLFTHSQTALNWISLHYSLVSDVSASHNLRSANQRLFWFRYAGSAHSVHGPSLWLTRRFGHSTRLLERSGSWQGQLQTSAEVAFSYTALEHLAY